MAKNFCFALLVNEGGVSRVGDFYPTPFTVLMDIKISKIKFERFFLEKFWMNSLPIFIKNCI